jgi:transcriptional regulator with XRE-family HTH domain
MANNRSFLILSLYTPKEVAERLGARMMELRLARDWRRATLAERAGVSPATVARFEATGQITLENLLKLAHALDALDAFEGVFVAPPASSIAELERSVTGSQRRRGRR